MIRPVVGVLFGLFVCGAGVWSLAERVRLQLRGARAPGVIVGRADAAGTAPGIAGRSGMFRFRTPDGREIEVTSSVYSFPGPRPGKRITVVYDPARPYRGAERAGVHLVLMLAVYPLVVAIGAAIAVAALLDL
ncbi:DUF3592 domain-containing protein [Actinomadura miaoliensis]|uniref:DUF3592 domain-containing protein n=1 Tax=Actinomadura miaoliensis TaxID=430685 RepID=A0ABP7VFV3_9ACTN